MSGLDHLVLATPDLPMTVTWIEKSLGVRPGAGGQHMGRGTRNFLLSLGPGYYLEIIGPDREQPEPPHSRPFGIDQLIEPALVAWAVKSTHLEHGVEVAAQYGYDLGTIQDMARTTPTGLVLHWRLTVGFGSGVSVVPFLIDWGASPHPSSTAPAGVSLVTFRGADPQPEQARRVIAALGLNLEVERGKDARLIAEISGPAGGLEVS